MANMFAPETNTRAPRREAERLKTLAESLQQGGQYKGNEIVSGMVVKQSPLEHLARGLQTAAGGYFAGQAQNKTDEDERALQQRMADALGQWGDPQEAAAILAQDPRTSEMAFKLMMGEQDHQRAMESQQAKYGREDQNWEREAALKRELAAMRSGGGSVSIDPNTGEVIQGYSNKPLPPAALKMQQEAIENLGAAQGVSDLSQSLMGQVDSGELELSPVSNFINSARNWAGASNDKSVNFANMKTGLEKLRNDTLRLNKGVQTEGDAVRAMNEVLQSVNDPQVFRAAMEKLDAINNRAAEMQRVNVNNIRSNYNVAPMDFEQVGALPSPVPNMGGSPADKIRAKLQGKMSPDQIEAFLQSKGIQ